MAGNTVKNKVVVSAQDKATPALSKIKKDVERDYYMSADEALNYGLIDKII